MNWNNELSQLLNITYPIVQSPMLGTSTEEMTAAASNAGCLGSLAVGNLDTEVCIEKIRATRKLTEKPFIVNFFCHTSPPVTDEIRKEYRKAKTYYEQIAADNQLEVKIPDIDELKLNTYHAPVEAIIQEKIKIASFTFGIPDAESIQRLKANGTILIGTSTSVEEAIQLEEAGIDIIGVQGLEAGGHRGTFSEYLPKIGGLTLLNQVSEAVSKPILYAGGLKNGKSILAAKALGAQGFQVGSLLVGAPESTLKDFERERLRSAKESEIMITNTVSGRYAQGVRSKLFDVTAEAGFKVPFPYQTLLTGHLRRAAKASGNPDFVALWIGQSINNYSNQPTAEILKKLIAETEAAAK